MQTHDLDKTRMQQEYEEKIAFIIEQMKLQDHRDDPQLPLQHPQHLQQKASKASCTSSVRPQYTSSDPQHPPQHPQHLQH
jgi:hypothetical protein